MIDINQFCEKIQTTNITDVENENLFFETVFQEQKRILNDIYKSKVLLKEIKETWKENPKLSYNFLVYDKNIKLKSNKLTIVIDSEIKEENNFVNEQYLEDVVQNFYQNIENVSSFIEQEVVLSSNGSPLVNLNYFIDNYLTIKKPVITDCVIEQQTIEEIGDNNLIGLIDCYTYIIPIKTIIDLTDKNIKNLDNTMSLTKDSFRFLRLKIIDSPVTSIYLTQSSLYLNNATTKELYITNQNNYILDEIVVSDELEEKSNFLKTITLFKIFEETKAKKNWTVPELIKTDSNQTGLSNKIIEAVRKNETLDTNELVSYEELELAMEHIISELTTITEVCNE